jgi:hypothetical protein
MLTTPVVACIIAALNPPAEPALPPSAEREVPVVAFPHPLITEVLYAVPTGAGGDANGDGTRDAVGDEFIELVNPHDRPIQLRGYALTDRQQVSKRDGKTFTTIRFVFPALELEPGEIVVVFNGHEQRWSGPVGDSARAAAGNPRFAGARIFTMNNVSARAGLANTADCITLWSPSGQPLHAVCWGDAEPPPGTRIPEKAPALSGQSVTWPSPGAPMSAHPPMAASGGPARRYSPGIFPADAAR